MRYYYEINCTCKEDGLHLICMGACARCRKEFTVRLLKGFNLNDIEDLEKRYLMAIGMCTTCLKAMSEKNIQIIEDAEYYANKDEVIEGLRASVKLGLTSQEECDRLIREIEDKEKLKEMN